MPATLRTIENDDQLVRARRELGSFDLTVCTDGTYYLDGGAMFGVVPKPLWEKRAPSDAQNRILLGTNSVVVRTGRHTVVIETGIGNKLGEKLEGIYGNKKLLPASYEAAGVRVEDVDFVVNTHLHFDHCGWNTVLDSDGAVQPMFSNAQYFAQAGEVTHGRKQLERDRVSYISANYDPLVNSGQMVLLEGDAEICPGISVELFPGHTAQMQAVHIESDGQHACYIGDLIPTSAHLDITWVMGYDLYPLTCIEQRKRFYERAVPENWLVMFTHDHRTPMGYVKWNEKGKPVLMPA